PSLVRAPPPRRATDDHIPAVVKAMLSGQLVTVVGTGVNADGGVDGLPDATEGAAHLASVFDCPGEHARDLAHVASFAALTKGIGPLYDELNALFAKERALRPVDQELARLAALLRERGAPAQLIVTTNWDRALENAFLAAGEELDVVSYL